MPADNSAVPGEASAPAPTGKISCNGVWKLFGNRAAEVYAEHGGKPTSEALQSAGLIGAVQDASFTIGEGEIFVIMGLSGSGKSTLLRCMSRLIEPTAGEILFEDRDLLKATEKELTEIRRHKMGMVFQHFALLPHLTVLANVAFPLEIQGTDKRACERRAMEMIELVGLKGRERYYPRELSGGQQQRVGIARSLAVEPDVWFLDEPFSALDPLIRREMQDEFMRLQSVLRKTIAFITHDFDEAIRLADRIAIMKDGAIIQIGTPEDLVLNPASAYVSEFTRDIPRAKVLSARAIMRPLQGRPLEGSPLEGGSVPDARVSVHTKVEDLAEKLLETESSVSVIDEHGEILGTVSRQAVLDVLVRKHGTA